MSFEKNFCPSPWFHMRINNSGSYEYCRWKTIDDGTVSFEQNIKFIKPNDYLQNTLSPIRWQLLQGRAPAGCRECHTMEEYNKVSGRQRQLLKVGVLEPYFEKSLASSPLRSDFDYSYTNQGHTTRTVTDWQIDLGNYCNGACVYCIPESSSRLASEFLKLGLIDQLPPASWCDDPELLERFTQDLVTSDNLKYLHFIGGETLITPGFKHILSALVSSGQSKNISIGFTTNLTTWDQDIVELLVQFDQVNLGMSIESLTSVNDYVRWPSKQPITKQHLTRWVEYGKKYNWLIQLRVTPTCLTIMDLVTLYDYAWEHNIGIESCNFLYHPQFLRIGVLPDQYLSQAREKIQLWIDTHQGVEVEQIVNTRNPTVVRNQIVQDAVSYVTYLNKVTQEPEQLPELVKYLKTLEQNRGNCILDYLPEYEELFRSAGY